MNGKKMPVWLGASSTNSLFSINLTKSRQEAVIIFHVNDHSCVNVTPLLMKIRICEDQVCASSQLILKTAFQLITPNNHFIIYSCYQREYSVW